MLLGSWVLCCVGTKAGQLGDRPGNLPPSLTARSNRDSRVGWLWDSCSLLGSAVELPLATELRELCLPPCIVQALSRGVVCR